MKAKIKVQAHLVSDESSLPGLQEATFWLCSHMAERMKELLILSEYRATFVTSCNLNNVLIPLQYQFQEDVIQSTATR